MVSDVVARPRKSYVQRSLQAIAGLLSLRYFVLRASTASVAIAGGLVQTFVFARVLTPHDFSIYILIGSFGVSLWLFDLGAAKILFVRARARHLAGGADATVPAQSTSVVLLYGLIVAAGTLACFAVTFLQPSIGTWQAFEFAMFFSFAALNLVWFPLRNVSSAVDEFIRFEGLEAIRRVGHLGLILALLWGLPLSAFLILANALWGLVLVLCIRRLVAVGALSPRLRGTASSLAGFWRHNRHEILSSGNYAVGELTIYNFPYFFVPLAFGLGAPTIILDTVFKIFRGATLIYAAGLDPLVPRQTHAFAERDVATLKKATLTAAFLCAIPTFALCGLLQWSGDRVFALLLGSAATVPAEATWILVVLLIANWAQNVANSLLLHTGFFREIARVATFLVMAMAIMTSTVIALNLNIVGFIAGYGAVYIAGTILYLAYVVRGPFRIAAQPRG
jgi:O-antigen/teichoic acid export membrane protein